MSPSRRTVVFMPPSASDPESGSVIAQAPTLFMVTRSGSHRFFWASVPLDRIVDGVSPRLTPIEATMPRLTPDSSMLRMAPIEVIPGPPPEPVLGSASPRATSSSLANSLSRASEAIASTPKVLSRFRMMS